MKVINGLGYAYLTCVDSIDNKYKFYEMKELMNGTFDVRYGRIKGDDFTGERYGNYPMSKWNTKYNEKVYRHGYIDQTDYIAAEQKQKVEVKVDDSIKEAAETIDPDIANFLLMLYNASKKYVKHHDVNPANITDAGVRKIASILDEMDELRKRYEETIKQEIKGMSTEKLGVVFGVLRVAKVEVERGVIAVYARINSKNPKTIAISDFLFSSETCRKFKELAISYENFEMELIALSQRHIDRIQSDLNYYKQTIHENRLLLPSQKLNDKERALYDAIVSQKAFSKSNIQVNAEGVLKVEQTEDRKGVLFDNIKIYKATSKQEQEVLDHLSDNLKTKVRHIYRVIDENQSKKFNQYLKERGIDTVKEFWHGSYNSSWMSIMTQSLKILSTAEHGRMFGDGIYLAPSSEKSKGYTSYHGSYWAKGQSDIGVLGLYAAAYGQPIDAKAKFIRKNGKNIPEEIVAGRADSLHARSGQRGLRNDEVIVYDEDAVNINYLVEFGDDELDR